MGSSDDENSFENEGTRDDLRIKKIVFDHSERLPVVSFERYKK